MRLRFSLTALAVLFCFATLAAIPVHAVTSIAADIDASGAVDAADVQLVINAALGADLPFQTDVDFDPDRATTASDIQLVVNAARGLVIDTDDDGIADVAELNLREQLEKALTGFASPNADPTEDADALYTAFRSLSGALGYQRAVAILESVQQAFVASGGSLRQLGDKSRMVPLLEFTPGAVAKRRLERDAAKALPGPPTSRTRAKETAPAPHKNTVIYVNGIWTEFADFVSDAAAVETALNGLVEPYAIKYSPIWNPTAGVYDLIPQSINQKILEWVEQSLKVPDFNPTSLWVRAIVTNETSAGRNVIMLPHSQGNFHVRQALNDLPLNVRAAVNVIQLASPVKDMPTGLRNLTRVDIEGDLVSELSGAELNLYPYDGQWGLGDWIHALFPSPSFDPLGVILLDHHDLRGAYLQGRAKEAILALVAEYCVTP